MVTCYAASRAGVVVVNGIGTGDPAAAYTFERDDVQCIAAASDAPHRVFCGTFDAGLHRSVDGGLTWERVGGGVIQNAVTSVTVSPHDPDVIYAGTEPSAVYRSQDGGETWTKLPELTDLPSASSWAFPPRPHTHHVRWIEVDPADPDHLYVAVEAGALLQTHDGGETWEDRLPSTRLDTHTMAIHPDAPDVVRTAAGDGYAESHDGGESWDFPQDGLDYRYCWSVAIDPGDPGRVLLSSAIGARRAHSSSSAESYLYRRAGRVGDGSDGDATDADAWDRLDDAGVPTGDGVLRPTLAAGVDDGELFAFTDRGLFRTTNGGDRFERLDVELPDAFRGTTTSGVVVVDE